MKKEKNNFGFIAASSICMFLLLIMIVGNFGGKGTRAATTIKVNGVEYSCDGEGGTPPSPSDVDQSKCNTCTSGSCMTCTYDDTCTDGTLSEEGGCRKVSSVSTYYGCEKVGSGTSASPPTSSSNPPTSSSGESLYNSCTISVAPTTDVDTFVVFKATPSAGCPTGTIKWSSSDSSVLSLSASSAGNFRKGDAGTATITATLTATDGSTFKGSTSYTIKSEDVKTGCSVALVGSGYLEAGSSGNYSADVTRYTEAASDLKQSYKWTVTSNEFVTLSGETNRLAVLGFKEGITAKSVTLKVVLTYKDKDNKDVSCTASKTVKVGAEEVNTCDLKFSSETSSNSVKVCATNSSDKVIKSYKWTSSNAEFYSGTSASCTSIYLKNMASYNLNLTVTYSDSTSCTASYVANATCPDGTTNMNNYCCYEKSYTTVIGTSAECSEYSMHSGKVYNLGYIVSVANKNSVGNICDVTYNKCLGVNGTVPGNSSSPNGGGTPSGGGGTPPGDGGTPPGDGGTPPDNTPTNPQTGSALIFVVWSIGIAMVVYSFWYFKNTKEN